MPKEYWICPECKGNLDHGEKCDCKTADVLVIGFDECPGDTLCLTIARQVGNRQEVIKNFYDDKARAVYDLLTKGVS